MREIRQNFQSGTNMILNILKTGLLFLDLKIILKTPFSLFSQKVKRSLSGSGGNRTHDLELKGSCSAD